MERTDVLIIILIPVIIILYFLTIYKPIKNRLNQIESESIVASIIPTFSFNVHFFIIFIIVLFTITIINKYCR